MTIRVADLTTLDVATVQQEEDLLAELMQEENPTLDFRRGILRDYLAHYGGILSAKNQTEQRRLQHSMSLAAIRLDPTLADDTGVDNISSNYRVTRQGSTAATGTVTLVLDALATVTVGRGTLFSANGLDFTVTDVYTGRTSADLVVAATDQVLAAVGDGTFLLRVPVSAVTGGLGGNLTKGTLLSMSPELRSLVKAYATEDFAGGADAETNGDLLDRYQYGLAARAISGPSNMSSLLREWRVVVADSFVGMGDAEMLRDQHTIFPGSLGGRVDWYIRTEPGYRRYSVVKAATLAEKTTDGYGIWQLAFSRDEYPGLYDVSVKPLNAQAYLGSFEIVEDVRTAVTTPLDSSDGFVPDIVSALEATYSRFQAVVIQFKETLTLTTDLSVGDTADYDVTVRGMDGLAELQARVSARGTRNGMGDVLIKAPVPCFVTLALRIDLPLGQAAPDTDEISNALVAAVNYSEIDGQLPSSRLLQAILGLLPSGASVSAIDMQGRIRQPDGGIRFLRSSELLQVPAEPDVMSTPRTVAFFLDVPDVIINVATANVPIR